MHSSERLALANLPGNFEAGNCAARRFVLPVASLILLIVGCSAVASGQAKPVGEARVVTSGHLSREMAVIPPEKTAPSDARIQFFISVENRGSAPAFNIHLDDLKADGFEIVGHCWGRLPDAGSCGTASQRAAFCSVPKQLEGDASLPKPDDSTLCSYLAPHEAITVWGDLVGRTSVPSHEILGLVSWSERRVTTCTPAKNKKCDAATFVSYVGNGPQVISLGRAESLEKIRYFFRRYTPRVEILIPAAITLLGFFFTWWASRKQRQNEIWTTMLGEVHKFAMHHYMPMASMAYAAANAINKYCAERQKSPSQLSSLAVFQRRQAFYRLMMWHWWQRETSQKVGAFHLRTRQGEDFVRVLANEHLVSFTADIEVTRLHLERVKSVLEKKTSLSGFLEMLDAGTNPDINACWTRFTAWVDHPEVDRHTKTLQGYAAVLIYEVNLVSDDWYVGRARISAEEGLLTVLRTKGVSGARYYLWKAKWAWLCRYLWWLAGAAAVYAVWRMWVHINA